MKVKSNWSYIILVLGIVICFSIFLGVITNSFFLGFLGGVIFFFLIYVQLLAKNFWRSNELKKFLKEYAQVYNAWSSPESENYSSGWIFFGANRFKGVVETEGAGIRIYILFICSSIILWKYIDKIETYDNEKFAKIIFKNVACKNKFLIVPWNNKFKIVNEPVNNSV